MTDAELVAEYQKLNLRAMLDGFKDNLEIVKYKNERDRLMREMVSRFIERAEKEE